MDLARPLTDDMTRDYSAFFSTGGTSVEPEAGPSGVVAVRKVAFPRSAKSTSEKRSKPAADDDDYVQESSLSSEEEDNGRRRASPRTRRKSPRQPTKKKQTPQSQKSHKGTYWVNHVRTRKRDAGDILDFLRSLRYQ